MFVVSVQNLTKLVGHADFVRPFIWSRVSGVMRFRDGSDTGIANMHGRLCKSRKKCGGDPSGKKV
jgi:hypothetical protein